MKPAPPTFHGFKVNPNCGPTGADELRELEGLALFRVDRKKPIEGTELAEKVLKIVSMNLAGEVNLEPGENARFVNQAGHIGIPDGNNHTVSDKHPLYILLNSGFNELPGCTPVHTLRFGKPVLKKPL